MQLLVINSDLICTALAIEAERLVRSKEQGPAVTKKNVICNTQRSLLVASALYYNMK